MLFLQFEPADISDKLSCSFYGKEMGPWWDSREDGAIPILTVFCSVFPRIFLFLDEGTSDIY